MLTREQFAQHFNNLQSGLGDPESPLWIPDQNEACECFVCVKPLKVHRYKWAYFNWCNQALKGSVRCFSSSTEEQQEWWGFTNKDDVTIWMLKWA